ncbi:hypothetical protein MMC22_009087 [Lobaria immixta]|nr:hypothetical protein [Lobaria immixta]
MPTVKVPYKVLVNTLNGEPVPINSYDFSDISADIRQQWVEHVVQDLQPGRSGLETIRNCKIVLNIDGTANTSAIPTLPAEKHRYVYPDRFRIPPTTVEDLSPEEKVARAEMFAFGTLLYHIYSGHKPFNNLQDDLVEERFENAEFPADTLDLDQWPMILSSWSFEFARDLHASIPSTIRDRLLQHIKAHPYLSALQASGALLSAVSLGAPLILGAAGFSAVGPVAGSAAAAWQSSAGLVQAGSFFAWCQSAAMGGAAVGGIAAAGTVGASAVAGATLAGLVTKETVGDMTEERVREMYRTAFRTGP